jgi:hypothetical protein
MIMNKHRTTTGFWNRTSKALGKLWAGVVSLPDRQARRDDRDYPIFPPF